MFRKLWTNRTTRLPVGNDKHNAVGQIESYFRPDTRRDDVIHRRRSVVRPNKQLTRPKVDEFKSIAGYVSMEYFWW